MTICHSQLEVLNPVVPEVWSHQLPRLDDQLALWHGQNAHPVVKLPLQYGLSSFESRWRNGMG